MIFSLIICLLLWYYSLGLATRMLWVIEMTIIFTHVQVVSLRYQFLPQKDAPRDYSNDLHSLFILMRVMYHSNIRSWKWDKHFCPVSLLASLEESHGPDVVLIPETISNIKIHIVRSKKLAPFGMRIVVDTKFIDVLIHLVTEANMKKKKERKREHWFY